MEDLKEHTESRPILHQTPEPRPASICLWILEVVIVFGLISVVIWLSLTPKSPVYIITNAYIPALDGANSSSHSTLNTSILLNLEFLNPNKRMCIYYDDIFITLTYNDSAVIGSHSLPSFYQGYRETTIYVVLVNADHLQQLWKGITNRTTVFRVCLENVVRYKIFRSQTKHHRIYNEAYVPVGSDGRMSGAKTIKLQHTSKLLRKT